MNAVPFDTLKLARSLREDGKLTQEQAEGITRALSEAFRDDMATKTDIGQAATGLTTKIDQVNSELNTKIDQVKAELTLKIEQLRAELILRMEQVRSDLLKVVIAAMAVNSAVVLGAMFGLAKLLGH